MIVIPEDVWGAPFEELERDFSIHRDPNLWENLPELKIQLQTANALVVRNRTQVTDDLMNSAPNLRIIARAGVGLDNIDINAANARGIVVVAGLGANAVSVAELTLGLALTLLRNIATLNTKAHGGAWIRTPGRELSGLNWGILGCGATGLATATLLKGFGCHIYGYDPYLNPGDSQLSARAITLTSLEKVLSQSDVLSIHMPANASTIGMISEATIAQMKPTSIIVNVGRGEVINEMDLIHSLKNQQIAGAALDVREKEPPTVGALESLENVILTPHIAGITVESQLRIAEILAINIGLVLRDLPATHAVGTLKASSR